MASRQAAGPRATKEGREELPQLAWIQVDNGKSHGRQGPKAYLFQLLVRLGPGHLGPFIHKQQ